MIWTICHQWKNFQIWLKLPTFVQLTHKEVTPCQELSWNNVMLSNLFTLQKVFYKLIILRVSPEEWRINNHQLRSSAEYTHNAVIMMKTEAKGCVDQTEKESIRHSSDTQKDIDNRLKDIETWMSNEKDELRFNVHQMHEMLELKERLELMLKVLIYYFAVC